jgi:hypothetical protein
MRALNHTASIGLALIGMLTSISGIAFGEFKPILIGFVLLAGSAVFALLSLGYRPASATTPQAIEVPVSQNRQE